VSVAPGSRLAAIVGVGPFPVNSAHHQAVEAMPDPSMVTAHAPDGVIEAVEDPARRFCLGVQWHPEYAISPADTAIFQAFVAASRKEAQS
jgi:putative glutamine amidotransferase